MKYTMLFSVAMLSGCAASSVNVRGPANSAYAPINESGVSGEISYCNAGAKTVRDARREDAYKKMYASCGGPYEITREEDQYPMFCTMERRIWFTCRAAQPALSQGK